MILSQFAAAAFLAVLPQERPFPLTEQQLIRNLGAERLEEREAATQELLRLGRSTRKSLEAASKDPDAERAARAGHLLAVFGRYDSLDELVALYRSFGMPFPPDDALLIRFETGDSSRDPDGDSVPNGNLGFLIEPASEAAPPLILVGTQEISGENSDLKITKVSPEPGAARNIHPQWGSLFEINSGVATAVQCASRGWYALAEALLEASRKHSIGHHFGAFYQPADLLPPSAIAFLGWVHYANEITKPSADRAVILKHLKEITAFERKIDRKASRWLIESLEAALVPSKAPPQSVEAAIDALVDLPPRSESDPPHPLFMNLARCGFEAVPRLMEHVADKRLTRSVMVGFNNFPTYHRTVGAVVCDLLQELAGEELGKDWLDRRKGWDLDKADVAAWWAQANKVGEEAYLVEHVLPADPRTERPRDLMLRLIALKYPHHLPSVYRKLLNERPDMYSWPLAERTGESALPRDKKIAIFREAAGHANLDHRVHALGQLQSLDPPLFISLLVENLDALPETPKEPYWHCPESSFTHLVMNTEDPKAWAALKKAAKRVDVGLRMEMLHRMNYTYLGERQRAQRMDFLAEFLDDATLRDKSKDPEMFSGPSAGFDPPLEVRNMAAMKLAWILGWADAPDRDLTPEQWDALRARVRKELKR